MAERNLNHTLMRLLRDFDPIRVENTALPGTPDIECTLGWIECKYLENLPRNKDEVVKISHYTPQQRVRAIKRSRAGVETWFMLQAGREYFLFRGSYAAEKIGKTADQWDFLADCEGHWRNSIGDDFIDILMKGFEESATSVGVVYEERKNK